MMINANSIAHLRVPFPQYGQTDPTQTKRDFLTLNDTVQTQQGLGTDRANQPDLRTDLQEIHNYYRLRHDDLFHMKITQNGNLSGVKQAPSDSGKIHKDIGGDLKSMCATNQAPSPIDVTA
ncbi:MAG: hypothetical protein LAN63_11145 [Acidobacteriia bacterium]|nr:hypothetical protein [Terriglobia bacterium]